MKRNENCVGCHENTIKVIHKGVYKETKICLTCNIAKPFRSHHCPDCDNCIIRFDHHCPWIGGCVGKRNYFYFFIFLCILNINDIFIAIFGLLHIIYIYKDVTNEQKGDKNWIAIYLIELLPTLLTIIFLGCTMIFTTGLWIYHIKLICRNMTTKEEIKKLIFDIIGNTHDFGVSKNCRDFWTRHKVMENEYTVKDLRTKMITQNINNNEINKQNTNNKRKKQIKILFGMSKKEQQLKNKNKKELNNKNDNINDNRNEKSSSNEEKEENEDEFDNISIDNEKTDKIQNNDQIFKNIKERIQNKIKDNEKKDKNSNKGNSKSSSNKIKSNTDYKNPNKIKNESDSSEGDISDENDNTNVKIFNTSVKKKSSLNNNYLHKMNTMKTNQTGKKNFIEDKIMCLSQKDKGYQIAQKRLEELSSEITINQEIKNSMSIPSENSVVSSLSQS